MKREQLRQLILQELPRLLREDLEVYRTVRHWVLEFAPSCEEMEDRFERLLEEFRREREEDRRRWEENQRKWEENQRRWEENQRKWEENQRRWEEETRKWEERWEENQKQIRQILKEIQKLHHKHAQSIGALGARWGLHSEATFRNALAGILQEYGIQVKHLRLRDEEGVVFHRPDQVEIDLLVHDGKTILAEIKSSMSKADMVTFDRKVSFYQRHFGHKVDRKIVISPMVAPDAQEAARDLGIEVYTFAEDAGDAITQAEQE